jgi:hypothetical protein
VLNEDYLCADLACLTRHYIDARYRSGTVKGSFTTFTKALLNVDNEYGCIHLSAPNQRRSAITFAAISAAAPV